MSYMCNMICVTDYLYSHILRDNLLHYKLCAFYSFELFLSIKFKIKKKCGKISRMSQIKCTDAQMIRKRVKS